MIVKKKWSSSANGREKNWSKFRVVLTKEMQGGNINAFRPQSDYEGLGQN